MANFTALKTAIQNAIKQNGNEEITGNLLQEVLIAIVTTLGDGSINDLVTALGSEATTRGNADTTLQQNINAEATTRSQADTALGGRIDGVVSSIEAINNAIGNGYVYAGIATPSSTPTTGKVFYLALTAGTYTNFGNIAVAQGINILKYNGSAWSLDAFVGIDDTPTPSSSNMVKSGGVFNDIMTNGSAFDLSAYNNGTTYADLNAALTALNTLPAAYKKGGMSMKFVLTSDNKYIQARCMAQNFTTDVTQWQGVDDEPTAGSNNLVKSGGMFPTINAVNKSLIPINGKVSIIGDSISTFAGTMPAGYATYYPQPSLGVTSLYDMWWHLLLSMTNSALEINASWSGSRVTNTNQNIPDFYARTNVLGSPNYIFVALGSNDSSNSVPLGNYDYDSENLSESEFIPAYIKGVKALKTNYPNAKIVLFVFQMADSYANAIKNIGKHYELDVIDVRSYYIDNAHPNKLQMCSVAQTINSFYIRGNAASVEEVSQLGQEIGRTVFYCELIASVGHYAIQYLPEFNDKATIKLDISCENITQTLSKKLVAFWGYSTEEDAKVASANNRILIDYIDYTNLIDGNYRTQMTLVKDSNYPYLVVTFGGQTGLIKIGSPRLIPDMSEISNIENEIYPLVSATVTNDGTWKGAYIKEANGLNKVGATVQLTNVVNPKSNNFFAFWGYTNESDAQSGSANNRVLIKAILWRNFNNGNGKVQIAIAIPEDYPYLRISFGADSGTVEYSIFNTESLVWGELNSNQMINSPLQFGAIYDGIYDCAPAIQACLDNGGTIVFEGNGTALVGSTLIIKHSNTHIVVGDGFTMKLANGVNAPIIRTESAAYYCSSPYVDTQRISNISISGGKWDLNHSNQTKDSAYFMYQAGFLLADIDDLDVNNIEIINPISYGMLIGGINRFHIYNINLNYKIVLVNMDGIHLHGNCKQGVIENIWGNTHDDMIALNFDNDAAYNRAIRMLRRGDCYDINVHNIFGHDAHRCVRLFGSSTYKIDNIVIDGLYGNYKRNGVVSIAGWYKGSEDPEGAIVKLGTVIIKNVLAVAKHDEDLTKKNEIINIGEGVEPCEIKNLILENIEIRNDATYISPLMYIERYDATIDNLTVLNCKLLTSDIDNSAVNYIGGYGTIKNCIINNNQIEEPETQGKVGSVMSIIPENLLVSNSIFNAQSKYSASGVLSESNVIYNGNI